MEKNNQCYLKNTTLSNISQCSWPWHEFFVSGPFPQSLNCILHKLVSCSYTTLERESGGRVHTFSCLRFQIERFKLEEKSLTHDPHMKLYTAIGRLLASGWLNGCPDLRQDHSEFWKFPSENFSAIGWSPLSFPLYTRPSFSGKSLKMSSS